MQNETRLMRAYTKACDAPTNVPLQASIVEMQRKAESIGLTDSEMLYWATRLEELTYHANESEVTV